MLFRRLHRHAQRHFEKHYRARYAHRAHLFLLIDGTLTLAALFLLGLGFYFRWFYHPLRDVFRLNVTPIGEIVAGREAELAVVIQNAGKTDLHDAKVTVYLPASFIPADGRGRVRAIDLAYVPSDTPIDYIYRGTPVGPPQETHVIARFSAVDVDGTTDERLFATTLKWDRSLIEARFETPDDVVPGQTAAFRLHVKNGSGLTIDDASVKPTWPNGFRLLHATPPQYRGALALGRLDPGEEVDLDFSGRFDGASDLLRTTAELTGSIEGAPYALATASADFQLIDAGVKLEAVFPDGTPAFIRPGQEVDVLVRYRNDGSRTVDRLKLGLRKDASAIAVVRWEGSDLVEDLAPGASGERLAHVRLLDAVAPYGTDPSLRAVPTGEISLAEPKLEGILIDGAAVETKISGDAKLRAAARYFTAEGDQIGRGALPPRVGSSTRYWILANLSTGATETQDGTVTFTLPAGVAWTGRGVVTAGADLQLVGNRLVWRIGTLAAHAGRRYEAPSASFEVSLTPTADQAGTTPALLQSAEYQGLDAWTGSPLASSQGRLDTTLPGDPGIAGRTTVRP